MSLFADALKLLGSPEGKRLLDTMKRHVEASGEPLEQVLKAWLDHMDRLEAITKKTCKTVKQVEDEALKLYEEKHYK